MKEIQLKDAKATLSHVLDDAIAGKPAIITRHGKRVTNVRMEAWQADRSTPVATAHAIFLVMR